MLRRASIKRPTPVTQQYSRDAVFKVLEDADYKTLASVMRNYQECQDMVRSIVERRLQQQTLLLVVNQDVNEKVTFEFEFSSFDTASGVVIFKAKRAIARFQLSSSVKPAISQIFIDDDRHNVLPRPISLNIGRIDVRSVSSKSDWTFVYETECNTIHRSLDRVVIPISFECRLDFFMPVSSTSSGKKVAGLFRRNSWKKALLQQCEDMHHRLHTNSRITRERPLVYL
ncbi:hypothetical protein K493DRAFT_344263 [Basidiobolus meristosporus CBS 931.73]|uniref:Uncharacterized protein n=1 Tax=Basidiobolus meristosporus CBS 931.73 TaxID=1314790 RepID=A0A1Y1Z974_9FUNG|nr:hypothetical protein K493DRAFT_344263 [Basidiobolus meristosporus CBS 931.73]|eukprot:ORY06801.1 hypothetical protein K493DRAFT_344263 [Basidiobolus meristosporus CBS 931.73]